MSYFKTMTSITLGRHVLRSGSRNTSVTAVRGSRGRRTNSAQFHTDTYSNVAQMLPNVGNVDVWW